MKKLLVLMLVLSMVTVASATISWDLRKADGTTSITAVDVSESINFTLVLTGLAADLSPDPYRVGIYEDGYVYGGGLVDFVSGTLHAAAGDLGYLSALDTTYDGFGLAAGQLGGGPPNAADGDWVTLSAKVMGGATSGSAKIKLEESTSPYGLIGYVEFDIIPEPVTIALLGLGGLFLRRRK